VNTTWRCPRCGNAVNDRTDLDILSRKAACAPCTLETGGAVLRLRKGGVAPAPRADELDETAIAFWRGVFAQQGAELLLGGL
jgi:hypothetical protein